MKLELIEKKDNQALFHVKETTPHYMNTLRRLLMQEVPVLAIEEIEFRQNSSILYDEIVAHRLGMVPLTTDLKSYELEEKAKTKAESEVVLTLKAKADDEAVTVYAKDLKSKDKKVKPVNGDIPIVKLQPGQEIEAEMKAVMGQGKNHSKWSPCLAWFKYYPHVNIKKQPKNPKKVAEEYTPSFEVKSGKLKVNEIEMLKHDVLDETIEDETDGAITYKEEDDFVFFIESWGQIDIEDLMEKAIEIHNDQLKEFKKLVKDL